jgi:hypothetical protein
VSASALLDETTSLLRATLPPGVELVVSDVPTDLAVVGEAAQVQQIILNLCKNAAQAMEGSGRICIMADAQELDQPLGYEPVGFERSGDAIAAVRAESVRFDAILVSQASARAALDLARAARVGSAKADPPCHEIGCRCRFRRARARRHRGCRAPADRQC